MDGGTLVYIIVFFAAIICLFIYKKINPESFRMYFIWVVFNLLLGLYLLRPWGIFG
ncbi:hypothetical protein ANASTE_00692 [Anaerofustis stercorihominis DSM 17244]|uniref:Uncharacterized protein n=1 Tax=Anaerofustis stercorihominis DSM 17244 TaxID=445971 RepID=B1C7J0_9FIRM|nr:hypothetical protein [Anaerofustis stercorihominis]EDS72977.1 hypothetical protein ANASTE_00692 [Anaerofustis stercorihominis DSM 17244]